MAQLLSAVTPDTIVRLNENGSPVQFYVAAQNYESSLNGAGRTLVVRKDTYDNRVWDNGNVNAYASSDLDSWFNSTYKNMLDADIRSLIGTTKIRYTPGNGNWTVGTLERAIFALSITELGKDGTYANTEGSALPIASTLQIAYRNGSATTQWTRSPDTYRTDSALFLLSNGNINDNGCNSSHGSRPAFTLPSSLYVWGDGTVSQYAGPAPSSITTPSLAMQGQSINVSWSAVGSADSYILQRKADSGEWTQVYAGTATSYTDTAGSWSTVQYQVCGVFDGTNGAFAQSEVITVAPASALVISGTDGDLGTITADIPYSVATDTGNQISLTRTVNGAQVASLTVSTGFSYNIPVLELPTGTNTIVITASVQATSGQVTVTRTWTYTKAAQTFPGSGGVAQLTQNGQNVFPMTLAEAVKAIGGPWGGNLSTALNKLALAATYSKTPIPKYTEVNVDLSTAQSGDNVNLPVNGVMVPHIVVQVGNPAPSMYDASCDGVWLLRKDISSLGAWDSSARNNLSASTDIIEAMQENLSGYDENVQANIQTVKIPYCIGGRNSTVNTLSNGLECKFFPLSAYELGSETLTNAMGIDGTSLDYFKNASQNPAFRVARYDGNPYPYWTRTPTTNANTTAVRCEDDGTIVNSGTGTQYSIGYRPCFTLPVTFTATYYVDTAGNVYPSQEYTTAGDFYDLWGNVIPTVKIATGSYTGTGTYGSDNPNTLTFSFEPKFILILRTVLGGNLRFGYLLPQNGIFFSCQNGYGTASPSASDSTSISASENSVSWYFSSAEGQFNAVAIYYYVAIG